MKQMILTNGRKKLRKTFKILNKKKYIYDFQQHETIRSFGGSIYTGKINIDEAITDLSNLLKTLTEFRGRSTPKTSEGKDKKRNTFERVNVLYESWE